MPCVLSCRGEGKGRRAEGQENRCFVQVLPILIEHKKERNLGTILLLRESTVIMQHVIGGASDLPSPQPCHCLSLVLSSLLSLLPSVIASTTFPCNGLAGHQLPRGRAIPFPTWLHGQRACQALRTRHLGQAELLGGAAVSCQWF